MLLAVPGSGKTTTIVAHLGYLIFVKGVDPSRLLTITYTNAATKDLRKRFKATFSELFVRADFSRYPEFRTINSLAYSIIHYYIRSENRTPFDLIKDKDVALLLRNILKAHGNPFPTEADISDLGTKISYIKNMMLDEEGISEAYVNEKMDILSCYKMYCETLRQNKLMDYDDQMVIARSILLRYPEILEYFQNKYKYICVDEAQDTSKIQHEIIRLLALGSGNLLMVGDEDQSIYGFRAAFPEALLDFESTYPDSKVMYLSNNYRSTPSIVKKSKAFIKLNTRRMEKEMHEVREFDAPIHVETLKNRHVQYEWLLSMLNKHCIKEMMGINDEQHLITEQTLTDNQDSIKEDIGEMALSQSAPDSIAVLYRNNESALPLVDMLELNKIPYSLRSFETSFFTHIVVQDILNTIALAFDPHDYKNFMNMYYKFGLMISKDQARMAVHQAQEKLNEYEYSGNEELFMQTLPWSALIDNAFGAHRSRLNKFIENLIKINTDSGNEAVHRILHEMGYAEFLSEKQLGTEKADILSEIGASIPAKDLARRLRELEEIILKQPNQRNFDNLNAYNGWEHEVYSPDINEAKLKPAFELTLSTIHSAKGLEFDHVILFDMLPGIMPGVMCDAALKDSAVYEEERRLFYVAATRAKNHLYMFKFKDGSSPFVLEYLSGKKALNRVESPEKNNPVLDKDKYTSLDKDSATYKAYLTAYNENSVITHKKFGKGRIVDIKDDIVTVKFGDIINDSSSNDIVSSVNVSTIGKSVESVKSNGETKKFSISALSKLDLIKFSK